MATCEGLTCESADRAMFGLLLGACGGVVGALIGGCLVGNGAMGLGLGVLGFGWMPGFLIGVIVNVTVGRKRRRLGQVAAFIAASATGWAIVASVLSEVISD